MAFIYKGTWMPNSGQILIGGITGNIGPDQGTIVNDSAVVKRGDIVSNLATGTGTNSFVRRYTTAGDPILGVLVAVMDPATGGTATPDSGTTDTWTMGSSNTTSANPKYAVIDMSPWSIYSAPLSATIHTTANAVRGTAYDPDTGANAGRILESSASRTAGAGKGLVCHGVDQVDTTRALVSIAESYLFQTLSA